MATLRETLRIDGESGEAKRAVDDVGEASDKLSVKLGDIAKGAFAFASIQGAAALAKQAVSALVDAMREQVQEARNLQDVTRGAKAMVGAIEPGARRAEEEAILGLYEQYAVPPEQIATLRQAAFSVFQQRAQAQEAIRIGLRAQVGVAGPGEAVAEPMVMALSKAVGAYPGRGGDLGGLADVLFRGYQRTGVAGFGEYAAALPEVLMPGAAAGIPLEQALTAYSMMVMGAPSGAIGATRARAGFQALLGRGAPARKFMEQQGLAGLPFWQRIERLKEITAGMGPEQMQEFLEPFLPEVEARQGIQAMLINLGSRGGIEEAITRGAGGIGDYYEAVTREPGFQAARMQAERRALGIRAAQAPGAAAMVWERALTRQERAYPGPWGPNLPGMAWELGREIISPTEEGPTRAQRERWRDELLGEMEATIPKQGGSVVINNGPTFNYGSASETDRALKQPPVPPR